MYDIRFIRRKDVQLLTGLSRSSIYNMVNAGSFPPQVKLGGRSVAWVESEVQAWAKNRIAASRQGQGGAIC